MDIYQKQEQEEGPMLRHSLSILLVLGVILGVAVPTHAVFIGAGNGDLFNLDVTTNTSTFIGNSGATMFDIALSPTTNILYGVAGGGQLRSIDQTTGASTFIGNTNTFINGLTFGTSGTLYGTGGTGLYTIDLVTGGATFIGVSGFDSSGDIAFDSSGNLYLSAAGTVGDALVLLNPATGSGTLIGNIGFSSVYGLNFFESTLFGFTADGRTLDINTTTGAGAQIALNGINAFGADGVGGVAPVPEPGTLMLLGSGLVGLVGYGRRQFKK